MKKIKYLLLIVLSIFTIKNVFAEVNKGMIYEVPWASSGVGVFASDETYYSMDYNGWMLVSSEDNNIYYCVEPSLYMQNTSDAVPNTHTYVYSESEMKRVLNISNSSFDRIKLLAFYGYGYKDEKVDHTAKKWYGITQVLIWREVRKDINYVFKTSRYGTNNNSLYLNEIKELNNLVSNHYKVPSFNEIPELLEGKEYEFIDNNNVLYNYEVTSDLEIKREGNKLIIKASSEGEHEITFKRKNISNSVALLTSTSLQNLMVRGSVNTNNAKIDIKVKKQDVTINKVCDDKFYDDLKGTLIDLYDKDNNLLKEINIQNEDEVISLEAGSYYLKEKEPTENYLLNENRFYFNIDSFEPVNIKIENKRKEKPIMPDTYSYNYSYIILLGVMVYAKRKYKETYY